MIISPLHLIITSCDLNSAVHPASPSLPIETSEMCVRLCMMWPSHASSGKTIKSSKHGLLDVMVYTVGDLK